MIDHISSYTRHYLKSRDFYSQVFAPLGYLLLTEFVTERETEFPTRQCSGFGVDDNAAFWVIETRQQVTPRHIAFSAESTAQVNAFYQIALAQGATCNGPPGLRSHYHPNYYAAFVIDLDGNDIEAVCHDR